MRNRRILCALAIACAAADRPIAAPDVQPAGHSCFVQTPSGVIQGIDNGVSCTFLGIPFAAPPVGPLRWKPPQPAIPWAPGTLNATVPPPPCPSVNPPGSTTTTNNEDCLKLNIWVPDPLPAGPAPVIFWIHPGAFVAASANLAAQNGRKMAERTGAIVVAANYRLGPFGFLGHAALTAENPAYPSSGNYGFLDQRAALGWVREHIAALGGDPWRVTIAGASAGAHSVGLHLVSPGSAGYFTGAIMQSGYASTRWKTLADGEELGSQVATALGCTDPALVLACMRSKTAREVLLALPSGQQVFSETPRADWSPLVDGVEIPDQPRRLYEAGAIHHVPVILGATRDEGWVYVDRSFPAGLTDDQYRAAVEAEFGADRAPDILARYPAANFPTPKHALSRVVGDVENTCEARRVARLVSRTGSAAYLFSFEREVPAVAGNQVIHGIDTNFTFGNNYGPPTPYALNADDLVLSNAMIDYWARFAATGDPNLVQRVKAGGGPSGDDGVPATGIVRWPESGDGTKYLVLDVPLRENLDFGERCDYWDPQFLRSTGGSVPAAAPDAELCGATITRDVTLDHDLACGGNGLIAGADFITIDLNGYTIAGSGTGAGINVTGYKGVSILGGTIRNFFAGVLTRDATQVKIRGVMFDGNTDGVDLQQGSHWNTIAGNRFQDSRTRAIMIRSESTHHLVAENTFMRDRVGILVFGGVENTLQNNVITASSLAAIRFNVLARGNLARNNTIVANPAAIEFLVTPTGSSIENVLIDNIIRTNTCGVKGPVTGNTLKGNLFDGNSADGCL